MVCFAYGLPHKPYIQTILPHGLSLPKVPKGDQVWQHSEACQQRVDADGNWLRQTDGKIKDKAIEREVEALDNTETFQNHTRTVGDHSTESVGGIKKIEALGALKLLSGGSASLAAVDDLHQATGRDLNLVVGQKHNATVGGDMQERIEGLRKSVAGVSQRLVAPQNWIGSESVNLFQVVCDLLDFSAGDECATGGAYAWADASAQHCGRISRERYVRVKSFWEIKADNWLTLSY